MVYGQKYKKCEKIHNHFLICVSWTNVAKTQKLYWVEPIFSSFILFWYVDDIRNAFNQGLTMIFIENFFPEVRRVNIFKAILHIFYLFFGTYWALPSIWLIWDPKYYTFLESSWQNILEICIRKMDAYIKVGKIFLLTCSDWDVPYTSHCVLRRRFWKRRWTAIQMKIQAGLMQRVIENWREFVDMQGKG